MADKIIHKIKKITGWFLLCILLIISGSGIFVYFKAQKYLNDNLSQWVHQQTKGTYDLQFDNLGLSFRIWGFTIEKVKLNPVGSVTSQADSMQVHQTYYSFSSPEVNIKSIGLLKLLLQKKLEIGKFEILSPDLKITGPSNRDNLTERSLNNFFRELEPVVRKKFHSIHIKKIELRDANYNFYNLSDKTGKVSNAEHITIGINNFYTDSLLLPDPDRLFDAEDVFIRMNNYENHLSDSLHILSADELFYSLKKAYITGKNVRLQPVEDQAGPRNRYRVTVPFLKLKSKHIHEFYTTDSIRVDSLILDKAEIEFYPRKKPQKITLEHISNFDLYELVKNDFKSISIHHFTLNNARLKLYNFRQDYYLQQEMGRLNLKLKNFYLDSVSIYNSDKIFYSDQLSISVDNYQLNLGDNLHRLEINKLSANSRDRFIRVDQAKVRPISEDILRKNKRIAINVDCDSLKIREADLKQAFHFRRLPIGRIELHRPVTTINRYDTDIERPRKSSSLVYEMISEYFLAVYANLISIENGKLIVNNMSGGKKAGYIQSGIDFQLTDFALDSISAKKSGKLFFATNIDLVFSNYEMQLVDHLHRMTIEKIDISSSRKRAGIENLHLYPFISRENPQHLLKQYGHSELYEVKVPYLFLLNTDIHQAFFNKKLTIGNFRIINPEINLESFAKLKTKNETKQSPDEFYDLLSNYIKDVDIRHIEVKDGEIKLTNHDRKGNTIGFDNKFNLLLEKFRLNKNEIGRRKLLFSENVDLKIKKYLFRLSDHVHYLQAGEIGLSTFDSRVYVYDTILYPDITNPAYKKMPWNIYIGIPAISLSGVDLLKLYYDGRLTANQLSISKPEIKLYKVGENKKNIDFKEFTLLLPEEIKELSIDELQLNGGVLQLLKEVAAKHQKYMQGFIEMKTSGLKIENNLPKNPSSVTSGIFTTKLKNLWIEPIGRNQHIGMESIDYSTNSKKIGVKNLSISPKTADPAKNQYSLKVPKLQLNSFNIGQAYTNNQYFFDQITLSKPEFIFYRNTNDSTRFNPYTIDLFPYFKDFADVFATKRLSLEGASFQLFIKGKKTVEQQGIDLNLSGFRVAPTKSNRFLYSDQFAFNFNDVVRYDSKKLYRFNFDRISFSSIDNHFVINGIHLEPQYSREELPHKVGHQVDYFTGSLREIRFEDMDLQRWFDKQELVGKRLQLNGLNLDVYRDKRIPFNEKQRPAMPQNLIRNFDLKFYFDSLELNNANISYAEQIEESPEAGKVDFKNLNASLKPFTNIPYLSGVAANSQLNVNAHLMGEPLVSVQIHFDLFSPANLFEVQGYLAPCSMNILNPMTEHGALMEINSGTLDKFEFHFTGDNDQTKGKLKFAYDNLRISILAIKNGNTKKSKFSSFMANSLMIKSKNPRGKILLPDDIDYRRDPSRSILNYWWKSIFSGVKNIFGIKGKKED